MTAWPNEGRYELIKRRHKAMQERRERERFQEENEEANKGDWFEEEEDVE